MPLPMHMHMNIYCRACTPRHRYVVKDLLGHGTFGQVFKCVPTEGGEGVAVKVIKNQAAYYHQARVEIGVLQFLNTRADPRDEHHIVRLKVRHWVWSIQTHALIHAHASIHVCRPAACSATLY